MEVKSLDTVGFSVLMDCFHSAFDNYYVKMPTDNDYYKERWAMAGVQLNLSYGMFENDHLVGFIINAIDTRGGVVVAFNTGTGVLPEYRGQRIVRSIYEFAIPRLKKYGVTVCQLEVIKDNTPAIKAYQNIGFSISKNYKCYQGAIEIDAAINDYLLEKVDSQYFDWDMFQQSEYSWDNHLNTIVKGSYHYYCITIDGHEDSYFVINPESGYVPQFKVLNHSNNNWIRLFAGIQTISKTIKINNVDEKLTEKIEALKKVGMTNTVDQYEMELIF